MSQNDLSIANADGATVRADLNSALQAIASQNSGASAPSTTYANMLWYDTANSLIKIRNAANGAWITLFAYDGSAISLTAASSPMGKAKGTTIASAGTTDIGAADSDFIDISGTTTITSLGSTTTRNRVTLNFQGALTLTHNGTSLILPGAANITTAAGDVLTFARVSGSNWQLVAGQLATGKSIVADTNGKHALWFPAASMISRTTNGAASGTAEMSTNKNMVKTLDFDATTQEFAQFWVRMPKSWNESTVTFIPEWAHGSTVTNFGVVWALEAVAISNDDTLDAAFGTAQTSTDTGGTTNDNYSGPESSAITIGGTPAEGDLVNFQIKRVPSDGSDTLAVDAKLIGITLFITTNAGTDA